jgi:hypothetical protein
MRRDSRADRQGQPRRFASRLGKGWPGMTSQAQEDLGELRAKYGDQWEIWVVYRVYGGPVWCARRHDDHRHVLNASSPMELEDDINEAEGGG